MYYVDEYTLSHQAKGIVHCPRITETSLYINKSSNDVVLYIEQNHEIFWELRAAEVIEFASKAAVPSHDADPSNAHRLSGVGSDPMNIFIDHSLQTWLDCIQQCCPHIDRKTGMSHISLKDKSKPSDDKRVIADQPHPVIRPNHLSPYSREAVQSIQNAKARSISTSKRRSIFGVDYKS